ncbi:MAG: hypothetical protein ISS16_08725 [Ignavibacteria bacterium]|nr:hypothetical protein [Ignavibacteria bacterium]
MRLRTATVLAITAFTYIFIIKTIGTVFPFIALVSIYVKSTETLSLIASFALVYFYVIFYKDYLQKDQAKLRIATSLAVIIIVLSMSIEVIRLMQVFDVTFIPAASKIRHTEAIVPLAGAIIMLFFFVSFYNENLFENQVNLKKATSLAIVGASAFVLLNIIVVVNYFYYVETRQPFGVIGKSEVLYIIGSVIIIFYFAVSLYFLISFYKVQEQT